MKKYFNSGGDFLRVIFVFDLEKNEENKKKFLTSIYGSVILLV